MNNNDDNLISVLIPIHGDVPYLEKAIESIKFQESVDFELVVVLDRPTEILKEQTKLLLLNLKNAKLLVSPGVGISDALNFGMQNCLGKYVARIDSDDEMSKDRLIKQKLFLDRNSSIVVVGTQIIKFTEGNAKISRSHYPNRPILISRILRIRNCIAHPSVMYRRDEVLGIGGYRAAFNGAEDYDLWRRLAQTGSIANMNEVLTKYRIWSGQDTEHYISDKNKRAYLVQLFVELEEIAPMYAVEILSKGLSTENLIHTAEEYLRNKANLHWQRLRCIFKINEALSQREKMLYAKFLAVVLIYFFKLSILSVVIGFTRIRKRIP